MSLQLFHELVSVLRVLPEYSVIGRFLNGKNVTTAYVKRYVIKRSVQCHVFFTAAHLFTLWKHCR